MKPTKHLIRCEIYKAVESLSGPLELLAAPINGVSKDEMCDAPEPLALTASD